jgi:phosphate transport system permease protein
MEAAERSQQVSHSSNRRQNGDALFHGLTFLFTSLVIVAAVLLVGSMVKEAWPAMSGVGFSIFAGSRWDPGQGTFGALAFIYGTIVSSLLALLVAGTIGVMIAVFLTELAPPTIRRVVSFLVEMLAAVPSIIFGLWGIYVLIPLLGPVQAWLNTHLGFIPLFGGAPSTNGNIMTAGLVLAIMILPTIAALSRDVMSVVPTSQREALLALGATRWEVIRQVVIPYARAGIIGALILGLGRAVGETMAVTMVIGNTPQVSASLLGAGYSIAAVLANESGEAFGNVTHIGVLFELGLVLLLISVLLNAGARLLVWRVNHVGSPGKPGVVAKMMADGVAVASPDSKAYQRGGGDEHHEPPAPVASLQFDAVHYARRKFRNTLMLGLAVLSAIVAIIPLIAISAYVVIQGVSSLSLGFFTHAQSEVDNSGFGIPLGIGNTVVGTIELVIASLVGLPIGLLSGIYLAEYGRGKFSDAVRFLADVMSGLPSIVAGLVGYALVVAVIGFSAVAGGFALGLLMFPVVTRATEEVLRLVPSGLREAALALGIPRWRMIASVVLPTAVSGIITSMLLGIARVTGETAPLLFTSFAYPYWQLNPLKPVGALTYTIYDYATNQPNPIYHRMAFAGALVLVALVVVLNLSARVLFRRAVVIAV